jgi:hypothetical protein
VGRGWTTGRRGVIGVKRKPKEISKSRREDSKEGGIVKEKGPTEAARQYNDSSI